MQTNTTPLHLAAINGHEHLAMLLIRNGASLTHKNSAGHNALVIAIMNGKKDVVEAIIESDHWRVLILFKRVRDLRISITNSYRMEALKSAFVSPITHCRQTPLRQLIKRYPDLTIKVFNRCISTNLMKGKEVKKPDDSDDRAISSDDPTYSITLNFELLEDSYVIFDDDNGKSDSSSLLSFEDEEVGYF